MFKWIVAMAALCVLSVADLSAQGVLTGRVADRATGLALPGANVAVSRIRMGASTDADGNFRIVGLSAGTYLLDASFIGYKSKQVAVIVPADLKPQGIEILLEAEVLRIEAIEVRALRAGAKTPVTYTNLSSTELKKNNLGQDVPYLLQWTPSAVVTSDAGTGIGYTGIRIRGSDPSRINVTINGIPLNDAESQQVYWVDLPDFASSVSELQIQRGVGTSSNGAGAFGATINLSTSKVETTPYAEVNATAGSFNTQKGSVRFGSGLLQDKFSIEGRYSRIASDGFIDRASADLESYFLSGAWLGANSVTKLNIFSGHEITYQAWDGVPADFIDDPDLRTYNSGGTEKEGEPYENQVDNYRQTHTQLLHDHQLSPNWKLALALHYTKGAGYYEQYKAEQSFENYGLSPLAIGGDTVATTDLVRQRWLDNDFYGTTYTLNYQDNSGQLNATLGGGFHIYEGRHFGEVIWARFASDSETGHRYYDNDARKTDVNVFGKVEKTWNGGWNTWLDLQVRRVGYSFLGINNQLQNVDLKDELIFFNPKAGLLYQTGLNQQYYASFGVAHREPNRSDYTENPIRQRPKRERLLNTEIGWRASWKKSALNVNFYHMHYDDQLALNGEINDASEYRRINIAKSYRAGLEISGGGSPFNWLNINGNLALSQNKIKQFTEYVDVYDADFNWLEQRPVLHENTDLAFSPGIVAGVELTFFPVKKDRQQLEVALLSKYVGKQYLDNTSDEGNVLTAYFFSDLRLRYVLAPSFAKGVTLTLLVPNVWNALYETNGWSYRYLYNQTAVVDRGYYPQAGRHVLVGASVVF
ncbi:MAG: TonB-dependent receptor [Saprospiraceae bacterium]|nr:TonB-dependent receptor [Saprospiraceae bacterium]